MANLIAWTIVLLVGGAIGITVAPKGRAPKVLLLLGLALFAVGLAVGPAFNQSDKGTAQLLALNLEAGSIVQLFAVSYASLIASCVLGVRRLISRGRRDT